MILIYYLRNNHSTLDFGRFGYYWYSLLKTWRNQVKIKNSDWFSSNTWGITLLHSIFHVLTINGNLYWKRGRIDLKSKRLNSILVNNSSLKYTILIKRMRLNLCMFHINNKLIKKKSSKLYISINFFVGVNFYITNLRLQSWVTVL